MERARHPHTISSVLLTALAMVWSTAGLASAQQQLAKLLASDGAYHDGFGYSVAISGDLALVGATGDDPAGSAYVFDIATADQKWKLVASDARPGDLFGFSVAIGGERSIVGA